MLGQFRESGLTREAFARQEGLRYTTFCTWVQREGQAVRASRAPGQRTGAAETAAPRMTFAQVALPVVAGGGLEVRLPDGTTVRGPRVEELAALVRALRR